MAEKQIFKSFGFTKIRNDSKGTKTSQNVVMEPSINNNNKDSQLVVPYIVHNLAGFGNPFINGRGSVYLGILKMSFAF